MAKMEAKWLELDSQTLEDDGFGNARVKLGTHFYSDSNGIQFDPDGNISFNNYNIGSVGDATLSHHMINLSQLNAVSDTFPWAFLDEEIRAPTSATDRLDVTADLSLYNEFRLFYNIYANTQVEVVRFTVGNKEFMWTFRQQTSAASPGIHTITSGKVEDGYMLLTTTQDARELYSGGNLVGEIFVGISRSTGHAYVRNSGTYLQDDFGDAKNLTIVNSAGYTEFDFTGGSQTFYIYSASNNANDPVSMTTVSAMHGRLALFAMKSSF